MFVQQYLGAEGYILTLTVGPLDVYAAADVDVARTVIHDHLVGLAHLVRHHKTRPASSVNYTANTGLARGPINRLRRVCARARERGKRKRESERRRERETTIDYDG